HQCRADALANAGRGAEASIEFQLAAEELAREAPSDSRVLPLRRQAAEQALRCGRVDQGLAAMGEVLAKVGVRLPASTRRALWAGAYHRARLFAGGVRFRMRSQAGTHVTTLQRLDTMWSATVGLSMMRVPLADYLGLRHLHEALKLGEPSRAAKALG